MRHLVLTAVLLLLLGGGWPVPAGAAVDVKVNIDLPVPPPLVLSAPPVFILPPALGFYVAVDVPHDLFRVGKSYYLYRDGRWYRARYYNGPWRHLEHRHLPPGLRKHKYERIIHYRDEEHRRYRDDREHYGGRRFKPDREWKEERREQRREEKEQRRQEREERKDERRYEKRSHDHDRGEDRGRGRHGGRDD
jgi:hypothetical protein